LKGYFINTSVGYFVLDETGEKILISHLYSGNAEEIAEIHIAIEQKGVLPARDELVENLKKAGISRLIVEDARILKNFKDSGSEIILESPNAIGKKIRDDIPALLAIVECPVEDFQDFLRNLNFVMTRKKIKITAEGIEGKDRLIIQSIETIDQLDKSINILVSRLREWYGLHFPELDKKVSNHLRYVKFARLKRSNFTEKNLREIGISEQTAIKAAELAAKSMGSEMSDFDFSAIQDFASVIQGLYSFRSSLAQYVEELMKIVAPNINGIVGPLLGARLIALGGGLNHLATKPSSTMQILGAERALFRSLKTGAKPPKHGIIFQWEPVHSAKWWLRGKIARALASKLTIAARVDAYSGEYIADNLLSDIKAHIKTLEDKYGEPPKKKKTVKKERKDKKKKKRRRKKRRKPKEEKA